MIDPIIYPYLLFSFFTAFFFWINSIIINRNICVEIKIAFEIISFLIIVILSILYAWRKIDYSHGGIDSSTYRYIFDSMSSDFNDGVLSQRIEKGYASIMWLIKVTCKDFSIFQFCFFFILLSLYKKTVGLLTINIAGILTSFMLTFFLIDSFNTARTVLATFIVFFVVVALSDGRYFKAITLTLLAASVQIAGLWGFVFIFYSYIYNKISNKKLFYALLLSSFAFSYFLIEWFKYILTYIDYGHYTVNDSANTSYANYIYATFLIVLFYYLDGMKEVTNRITKCFFVLLPTIYFVAPLYSAVPIAYRFNAIYILFFCFVIPDLLWLSFKKKEKISIVSIVLFLGLIGYATIKINSYFSSSVYSALEWNLSNDFGLW